MRPATIEESKGYFAASPVLGYRSVSSASAACRRVGAADRAVAAELDEMLAASRTNH